MNQLFGILLFVFTLNATAQVHPNYPPNIGNNEEKTLTSRAYTLISHVVPGWDSQRVTYDGVQNLVAFSKKNNLISLGLVSNAGGSGRQFFEPSQVKHIVHSEAGQHKLKFPNARVFFVSGGNLSLCLCELLRDTIRGASFTPRDPLHIFLVADAVYDDFAYSPTSGLRSPKFTLKEAAEKTESADQLFNYIVKRVFGSEKIRFCPGQNWYGFEDLNKADMHFTLYKGSDKIGDYGIAGKNEVRFIIADSTELEHMVDKFGVRQFMP